jgi:hypothetical protein
MGWPAVHVSLGKGNKTLVGCSRKIEEEAESWQQQQTTQSSRQRMRQRGVGLSRETDGGGGGERCTVKRQRLFSTEGRIKERIQILQGEVFIQKIIKNIWERKT